MSRHDTAVETANLRCELERLKNQADANRRQLENLKNQIKRWIAELETELEEWEANQ